MATFAIGDIHGNLLALDDLLRQLRRELDTDDVVVFLGDYIDRGPSSKECVDAILEFRHSVNADVVCLCGNHEDWLLRTRRDYRRHSWLLSMEAFDTIRSYSVDAAQVLQDAAGNAGLQLYLTRCALPYDAFFEAVPNAHMMFFESLVPYYESLDCTCVHGGVNPRVARIQDQSREDLIWGARGFPEQYTGLRRSCMDIGTMPPSI